LCHGEYEESRKITQLQENSPTTWIPILLLFYPLFQPERRSRTFLKLARKPQDFCKKSALHTNLCFAITYNCFWKTFSL
jgi:hypothetical protein